MPDWSCDNVNGQGELSAEITYNGTVINGDYTFSWTGPAGSYTGNNITNLIDGTYNLEITGINTPGLGCVYNKNVDLLEDPKILTITGYNSTDQDICDPNGSITILEVKEDNVTGTITDYSFDIFDQNGNPLSSTEYSGNGTATDPYNDLITNNYNFSATNYVTGCKSDLLGIFIDDISTNPVAAIQVLSKQISKSPPATPTGELKATAREADSSVGSYDFSWFHEGNSVGSGLNIQEHTISGQPAGSFLVQVRNTLTNCITDATAIVEEDIKKPVLYFSTTNMTICDPANGIITVDAVEINGLTDDLTDYNFHWYKDSFESSNLITTTDGAQTNGNLLNGLAAGIYYVVAEEKTLALESLPVQVEVLDGSTAPQVQLTYIKPQTSFNPDPAYHNGIISITVDGNITNTHYDVTWFEGMDITGDVVLDNQDTLYATGLTNDFYTVRVRDLLTNCESIKTYYIEDGRIPLYIVSTSAPNTYCINGNGRASANVKDNYSRYDYYWYEDGPVYPDGNSDHEGQFIDTGLSGGSYIVVAVDQSDPYRFAADTVQVEDVLKYPDVSITQLNPQRNCYIDRPTGQLMAVIDNDDISYYMMHWYQLPDTINAIANGSVASGLAAESYQVKATHLITGCADNSDAASITEDIEPVPTPEAQIISHLTNCISPNGEINANVGGNYHGYDFNWYFGSKVLENPDFIGDIIDELNTGEYSVTATDLETGCTSDSAAIVSILDKRVYPVYSVSVKDATCQLNDGAISLMIENSIEVKSIEWNDGSEYFYGPSLINRPAGEYEVTVTTQEDKDSYFCVQWYL